MNTQEIPYGYCHCGCGEKTKIATQTDPRFGHVKGEPIRYINGHTSRLPPEQRFWKWVDKRAADECWLWTTSVNRKGYGKIRINHKNMLAHRVSWEMAFGPIPNA